MVHNFSVCLIVITLLHTTTFTHARDIYLAGNVSSASLKVTSWKTIKNKNVVKQNFDYSCGASSLSTIFTYFYHHKISEKEILDNMQLDDMMASFADLAKVSQHYGYEAKGIFTNYDTLKKIKIPAIVYLQPNRNDHFSVVRAITENHVYLADSNWGNRKLSRKQFEKIWHTHHDTQHKGKVLLIIPKNKESKVNQSFIKTSEQNKLLNKLPTLLHGVL